jgi:23S rRNA (adenine2503-C2)-methyltransferase
MKRISPLCVTSSEFVQQICLQDHSLRHKSRVFYKNFYKDPLFFESLLNQKTHRILQHVQLPLLPVIRIHKANATVKLTLVTEDSSLIEVVVLFFPKRTTVCVSSQIGCRMACQFCRTGKMGFSRNLTVEEIVSQVITPSHFLNIRPTNIVFMGAGEPGENLETVLRAISILSDDNGMAIGQRHITISTSGNVCAIHTLAHTPIASRLAISLHSATPSLRKSLVPGRHESLDELHEAMRTYCTKKNKKILISHVLVDGINDSEKEALCLAKFLQGIDATVNVIPYNAHDCSSLRPSSLETIHQFVQTLREQGVFVSLRGERGTEISAACGQLQGKKQSLFDLNKKR